MCVGGFRVSERGLRGEVEGVWGEDVLNGRSAETGQYPRRTGAIDRSQVGREWVLVASQAPTIYIRRRSVPPLRPDRLGQASDSQAEVRDPSLPGVEGAEVCCGSSRPRCPNAASERLNRLRAAGCHEWRERGVWAPLQGQDRQVVRPRTRKPARDAKCTGRASAVFFDFVIRGAWHLNVTCRMVCGYLTTCTGVHGSPRRAFENTYKWGWPDITSRGSLSRSWRE